jgi:hypothetical protein
MALELGADLPSHSVLCTALSGFSSLSTKLIQYSWTHWDDPVDVSFHYFAAVHLSSSKCMSDVNSATGAVDASQKLAFQFVNSCVTIVDTELTKSQLKQN